MRSRILWMAALTMVMCSFARAEKSLSAYQQKIFDETTAGLSSVETALADASAKLTAGDIDGASGGYNTAVRNYNTHIRRLSQLPAENGATVALREKAQSIGAELKKAGDALKAGPVKAPPAPAGGAADKPADKPAPAAKLDYKQEEELKNARFYLTEIEPSAKRIAELTAGKLDAEAITEALNLMKFARQRMGYAVDRLNALPAGNASVAAESKRYNDFLAQFTAAQAAIEKAAPDADKQIAALGQQMTDDLAMVESWSTSLGDPQSLFDSRPNDAIAAVGQLPQMREAMSAMLKRWTARATDKPNDRTAQDMVGKLKYVDRQLSDLDEYTKKLSKSLPKGIDTDLAAANKLIETAVTERRPLYFKPDSGIAHRIEFAAQKVAILKAIDPTAAATAEKLLVATREKSLAAQKSLSQDIIQGNKKPEEKYSGADKEALRQRIITEWKDAHPNLEVVAVVFNTPGWSRTTRWDWSRGNQGFEKVDFDHIQPKLFYKLDETLAVEMPVDVYKDYMKDARIDIKPWDVEKEPPVMRTYLLAHVK